MMAECARAAVRGQGSRGNGAGAVCTWMAFSPVCWHSGVGADQVPSAWQVLLWAPARLKPLLQLKWTVEPRVYLMPSLLPLAGGASQPQVTTENRDKDEGTDDRSELAIPCQHGPAPALPTAHQAAGFAPETSAAGGQPAWRCPRSGSRWPARQSGRTGRHRTAWSPLLPGQG